MSDYRADLHCHSNCSDGSLNPVQLVSHAVEKGLKGLSITDHDNIECYKTAIPAAQKAGIDLISGVEFSTILDNVSIHLLAYSFNTNSPLINEFCDEHHIRRRKRNLDILNLLEKKGMPITESELNAVVESLSPELQKKTIGRPHIAQTMVKMGYVQSIQEAFNKYVGEGCPCYIQGDYFSPEETIDLIHKANGFAIIAHPHLIEDQKSILKLLSMNFDGIECFYSKFGPADHERWIKIAQHRNWLMTGGSDFHGDIKPWVPLGCSWVGENTFRILQKRYQENTG